MKEIFGGIFMGAVAGLIAFLVTQDSTVAWVVYFLESTRQTDKLRSIK